MGDMGMVEGVAGEPCFRRKHVSGRARVLFLNWANKQTNKQTKNWMQFERDF
jgi:hypothetical protein